MKIWDWSDLNDNDFFIYKVRSVDLIPRQRIYRQPDAGRLSNGFVYVTEGKCLFNYPGNSFVAGVGCLVYVPEGSHHTYTILSEAMRYILIDFKIKDHSGANIAFSDNPQVVFEKAPLFYQLESEEIVKTYLNTMRGNKIKCTALMYEFLFNLMHDKFRKDPLHIKYKKIMKGITFLEQNYINDVPTQTLATMCSLSGSQFRRLFKIYAGMSPVEYRNKLRLDKAHALLNDNMCNVTEAAYMVGFNDLYYFSKLFKKYTGSTPKSV